MKANLSVKKVSWIAPKTNKKILNKISFELKPGRIVGIVGPNGAGKSSLLKLIYRYQLPSTGVVELNGNNIWNLSANKVACNIAAVLQERPSDFALTVSEIISLGRIPYWKSFGKKNIKQDQKIIRDVMEQLSILKLKDRQLNTLSGGECQRVMIGRALAQEPSLLVLDEPTNHLDIKHQLEVLSIIKSLSVSIIISLHDLNMASSFCDDILLLKEGNSLGFGKPDKIFSVSRISDAFSVKTRKELLVPSNSSQLTFQL